MGATGAQPTCSHLSSGFLSWEVVTLLPHLRHFTFPGKSGRYADANLPAYICPGSQDRSQLKGGRQTLAHTVGH